MKVRERQVVFRLTRNERIAAVVFAALLVLSLVMLVINRQRTIGDKPFVEPPPSAIGEAAHEQ